MMNFDDANKAACVEVYQVSIGKQGVRSNVWRPLGPSFTDAHKFNRSFIFGDCRPFPETFRDLSDMFIANRDK